MNPSEPNCGSGRRLKRHELELWREVTRHISPMPDKSRPVVAADATRILHQIQSSPPPARLGSDKAQVAPMKPLAPLEQVVLRRLSRGRSDPEARIDLHGMRQAEAHQRLRSFLHRAHADGLRLTLVVTGKGGGRPLLHPDERGVLRRMLPNWLAAADLRHIVLGFTEAARRHGGEGAFYVQLRASNSSRVKRFG